jgi:hypothetical protein
MRRLALMKNITTTNATQISRVPFASPQAASRSLDASVRGGSLASTYKAPAVKDVAHLRSRRPPV